MKFALFIVLVLCTGYINPNLGQKYLGEKQYRDIILDFYSYLEEESVSINDCCVLLGDHSIEIEEDLFFQACDKLKSEEECIVLFNSILNNRENSNSLLFEKLASMKDLFFQGEKDKIENIITKASFYDEEYTDHIAFDILFTNGSSIYFNLNRYVDEPVRIVGIYAPSGESVFNQFYTTNKYYLKRLAVINDPNGFVNVREKPNKSSNIVNKLYKNQLFLYTPNFYNDWWRVYSLDGKKYMGYIHHSRIMKYPDFPQQLKDEIKKSIKPE